MITGPASGFTPRPYQEWAIDGGAPHLGMGIMPGFARYRKVVAILATGCHRAGQLVLRSDGTPVAVEKVKPLDLLLGPDGKPRVVLCLNRGTAPMYEVVPIKGEPFVVDRDHILTLWRTPTGRPGFEAGLVDVSVSEWLSWGEGPRHLHKLIRASAIEFDRVEQTPLIPAYILGVLIGDGSMKQSVKVSTPDREIHDALRAFADSAGLETKIDRYPGKCPDVRLSGTRGPGGNHILTEIGRLGLKVGSLERRIPDIYKYGTIAQRLELLAGLIDTDGSLVSGCCIDYITGSRGLADDVLFVARSLGFAAYMRPCEKRSQTGSGGTYYRISISGDIEQVPCRVKRKQAAPRRQKKNHLCTGFTIRPTGTVEQFYGFTLDAGDHRYLLGDFTITHNCGKTELFLAVTRRYLASPKTDSRKRVLILAHRDELVSQPIERAPRFGMRFAREQGKHTGVGRPERVIASTIQSMTANTAVSAAKKLGYKFPKAVKDPDEKKAKESKFSAVAPDGSTWPETTLAEFTARFKEAHPAVPTMRCERYDPEEIGLIVIDEAHHAPAEDYQTLVARFPNAYVLGVTATWKRHDGIALGEAFDAVVFEYNIETATADGWLVPVKPHEVTIDGLDLSKLRKRMGDLPPGPLGELLAEYAMPVAKHLVDLAGDRPTIVFCTTVAHAHAQAEALRKVIAALGLDARVESADGGSDKGLREDIVADFRAGKIKYLVNALLWTEGFDAPNARCVAMVRPTSSQSLLIQACGRGTRPEPGVVDQPHLRDDPEGRRAAIAASSKPDLLVLDFTAKVEKLGLVSVGDALAGSLTPEQRLMLSRIEVVGNMTIDAIAAEARRLAAEEAVRLAALSDAEATAREVDPFNPAQVLSLKDMPRNDPNAPRCSEKMATMLAGKGIAAADKLSAEQAQKIAGALAMRAKRNLCTYKQARALQKAGVPVATTTRMYYETASKLITGLTMNGWRRPKEWDQTPALGGRAPARAMIVPPLDLPRAG